jgi:hypothetical protein
MMSPRRPPIRSQENGAFRNSDLFLAQKMEVGATAGARDNLSLSNREEWRDCAENLFSISVTSFGCLQMDSP